MKYGTSNWQYQCTECQAWMPGTKYHWQAWIIIHWHYLWQHGLVLR